jgi:hypothetical protein
VLETTLENDEENKYILLEEKKTVTIIVTRRISIVIVAINLGTIALNVEVKNHQGSINKLSIQRKIPI